jgi:hypothetical protein
MDAAGIILFSLMGAIMVAAIIIPDKKRKN